MPLPERQLVSRIKKLSALGALRTSRTGRQRLVHLAIGDDCSVLRIPAGHEALVTTDFSLEGIHFRRQWHPPESIGHRCLARGLSDIAAMGGEPVAAFLSLAVPADLPQGWVDRFFKGLLKLAEEFEIVLAGGDTARSPVGVLADIVVVGSVPKGKAVLRSSARQGDLIYVTGGLGASAATLNLLRSRSRKTLAPEVFPRHFFPEPRIKIARLLRKSAIATSMIDISDGLSTDLSHICEESGVGAELWSDTIPVAKIGRPAREVSLECALHGGEDYELLFTARPRTRVPKKVANTLITCIGRIIKSGMFARDPAGKRAQLHAQGWEHFRHPSK